MEKFYEVFEEFGLSPATPEEWTNCRTTHDYVWMANVTTSFTERLMRDYMDNHRDPNIVANKMEEFIEFLRIQTGLSSEDTGHISVIGTHILEDREYRDDPERARADAREAYEESQARLEHVISGEVDPEIMGMAEEFSQMMIERRERVAKETAEFHRIEYNMASSEVEEAMNELTKLINAEIDEKTNGTGVSELEKMIENIFKDNN